jgi:Protein of unknown function (DUF3303)
VAKYVVTWKARQGGTAQQNHEDAKKNLATFAKWQAPAGQNFLQFLARVDSQGGYAVVETDDPASLTDGPSKFSTWFEFEVIPVVDIMDGVAQISAAIEFRESI